MKTKFGIMNLMMLVSLGFSVKAYAQYSELPQLPVGELLSCKSNHGAVGASYFRSTGRMTANLNDNYDSTQSIGSDGRTGFMNCEAVDGNIHCKGFWSFRQRPASVSFARNSAGQYTAYFLRSSGSSGLDGGAEMILPCTIIKYGGDSLK